LSEPKKKPKKKKSQFSDFAHAVGVDFLRLSHWDGEIGRGVATSAVCVCVQAGALIFCTVHVIFVIILILYIHHRSKVCNY